MPSNQTPNYQLNQWEADDRVLRTDFNADNAKIDAALAQKAAQSDLSALTELVGTPLRFASGSYTGTGTSPNTIQMGLVPKFAWISRMDGTEQRLTYFVSGYELADSQKIVNRQVPSSYYTCVPTADGLKISATNSTWGESNRALATCNINNTSYAWFAIGT